MIRPLAIFGLILFLVVATWSNMIVKGGMLARLDANPTHAGAPTILFMLGRYYELFNKNEMALGSYQRLRERYPDSKYVMDAHFGVALAHENLKDYKKAVEEYKAYLEKYPKSKYSASVQRNIEILKSR
jgi:TolA-binding protein